MLLSSVMYGMLLFDSIGDEYGWRMGLVGLCVSIFFCVLLLCVTIFLPFPLIYNLIYVSYGNGRMN
jgi:hypothetical protein